MLPLILFCRRRAGGRNHEADLIERPAGRGGLPLVGVEQASFPPLEALRLYGGDAVGRWLDSLGLSRADAAEHLCHTEAGEAYEREYQSRCPLYTGEAYAVLGGWHMRWPEDDIYDRGGDRLLLWTPRDAEPWVEVWQTADGRLTPVARIT